MPTVVGLLSDSHSQWERTKRALEVLAQHGATVFVHCGDVENELVLDQLAGLESHLVWGNCDWNRNSLEPYAKSLGILLHGDAGELLVDGKRLAFTHGHEPAHMRHPVVNGVEYLIHGHSHELRDELRANTRIINPGALHRAPTLTVATLEPATDSLRVFTIAP
jgi:putative phosphoesterase